MFLDFDGPVCAVFAALRVREVTDRLKPLVGPDLPADVAASGARSTCSRTPLRVVRAPEPLSSAN